MSHKSCVHYVYKVVKHRIYIINYAISITTIYNYIYKRDSFGLRNTKECSMTYRQSETYSRKIPQKLTTTACFIQEESSGGKTT